MKALALALIGLGAFTCCPAFAAGPPSCDATDETPDDPICQAVSDLGRFELARVGPSLGGKSTVEVLYADAWGTSIREQSVALIQRVGGRARILWTHKTLDLSSTPLVERDEATVYRWTYAQGGERINVSGTRTIGQITDMWNGIARGRSRRLAAEQYCFDAASNSFERCSPALGDSSASVHVFRVGWEMHLGYYLVKPNDAGHAFPRFQDAAAQAVFDEFFRTENLAKVVGKIVYCRCEGRWLGDPGEQSEFAVTKATLYAEASPKDR